jgi:hypothetical protein
MWILVDANVAKPVAELKPLTIDGAIQDIYIFLESVIMHYGLY